MLGTGNWIKNPKLKIKVRNLLSEVQNPESGIRPWIFLLIVLGAVFLAYFPVLRGSFLWDDSFYIVTHEPIKSLGNIGRFFLEPGTGDLTLYRPLRALSFSLDYALWDLNPRGFHLTSLLWHLINISLVFFLLRHFFQGELLPFLGALFFGLHPLQTEAVAWISARADLLFAAFYLAAFLAYLKSRSRQNSREEYFWWCLSLGFFALSLLSKEMAVTLPLILLAYEFLFWPPLYNFSKKKVFCKWGGYLLVAGLYFLLRLALLGLPPHRWVDKGALVVFLDLKIIEGYGRLLLYPQKLCLLHPLVIPPGIWSGGALLPIFLLMLIISVFFWGFKNHRPVSFALAFTVLTLLPVLHWVDIPGSFVLTERWLYIPLFGYVVLLVFGLKFLLDKARIAAALNFIVLSIVAFLVVFYADKTGERLQDWQSDYALFSQTTLCAPQAILGYMNLGMVHIQRGEVDKAIVLFERATELEPQKPDTFSNLALALKLKGDYKRAASAFVSAGGLSASSKETFYFQAAWCYYQAGLKDLAHKWWEETKKAGYKGPAPWESSEK
jgi:tetratricopeptide (TPR) repeat protein